MICSLCDKHEGMHSAIVSGQYYQSLCSGCNTHLTQQSVSSGHAEFNRKFDAATHQWEIAQPYTTDGAPSRDFIGLYPEKAKRLFSAEELRKYS